MNSFVITQEILANTFENGGRERRKKAIAAGRPDPDSFRAAVFGAGNFGPAVLQIIAQNVFGKDGARVPQGDGPFSLYVNPHMGDDARHARAIEIARRVNEERILHRLPGVELHRGISATLDIQEALRGKKHLLIAVPSSQLQVFLEPFCEGLARAIQTGDVAPDVAISSLVKGIPPFAQVGSHVVYASELIEQQLRAHGIQVGETGVQVYAVAGAGYGTDIALGAPYSLTVGTNAPEPLPSANELVRALIRAKSVVLEEVDGRVIVELGAAGKNLAAVVANLVAAHCHNQSFSYPTAFFRAFESALHEIAKFAQVFHGDFKSPFDLLPQEEDAFLTTFGTQFLPDGARGSKSRNAEFGARLLTGGGTVQKTLRQMAASRGEEEVTVEGLSVIQALYRFLHEKGLLDSFPLIRATSVVIALRDDSAHIPSIDEFGSPIDRAEAQRLAEEALYKTGVDGSHLVWARAENARTT